TCEDFVRAMEDASGVDLAHFRLWYGQAGTPRIRASVIHDAAAGTARLKLEQAVPATPGQPDKQPMPVPLRIALFDRATGTAPAGEQLVLFDEAQRELLFDNLPERPVLSINRGFSAPVVIETDRSAADLAFLSAQDDDPFARYEAMQQLMLDTIIGAVATGSAYHGPIIEAVRETLADEALDAAFIAEAVLLPSESFLGDQMLIVDPDAVHAAREALRVDLGRTLEPQWRAAYARTGANRYEYSPAAKGARRLRTVALGYIEAAAPADGAAIAFRQFAEADNMTDRQGALAVLANGDAPARPEALDMFYDRYRDNALVLDKWFTTQALSARSDTVEAVERLAAHPDFTLTNPNRLRALVGAFAANQRAFHDRSGSGYRFLADKVIAVDRLNPQTAAKLIPPLGRWRRFDTARGSLMRAELERVLETPGLSRDVFEQASKSLG
ncbi:MAG: aminopeptidase, partial [Sphingomonas bacterium]|nr:aminopeptidase [Sphingomonas bacterium]